MKTFLFPALTAGLFATTAQAQDYTPAMMQFLDDNIRQWAQAESIVSAITAQNAVTGGYDQTMIDQLDGQWRAEIGAGSTPTITPCYQQRNRELPA